MSGLRIEKVKDSQSWKDVKDELVQPLPLTDEEAEVCGGGRVLIQGRRTSCFFHPLSEIFIEPHLYQVLGSYLSQE